MKNVFTIDTEEWFHANYQENLFDNKNKNISTIESNIERYLTLFNKYNVKATFFVLGVVAEQHPKLIAKIAANGHEIASHGYGHQLVYNQTPEEFRNDIKKSKQLLENITKTKVLGYRAPSWSITDKSLWAIDILNEEGFLYSSSIFPTKNYLYGIPYAPRFKHNSSIYGRSKLTILHIPPSTGKIINFKVPFSGGAYFRLLPYGIINYFTKRINRNEKQPVIFYLHPREIDLKQPRLKLPFKERMIHYYGISGCEKKLIKILKNNEFETMSEMLRL